MPRYDAESLEVLVFTFKEGILSAVAHDLKLRVTSLQANVDGDRVEAQLDPSSLRVLTPMKDGVENPSALPRLVYGEIEKNTREDVLESRRYPTIRFVSSLLTDSEVVGELTLHGVTKTLRGRRQGDRVEFSFDQRDFGLKPYSAMLGTLKVKPSVMVRVTLRGA